MAKGWHPRAKQIKHSQPAKHLRTIQNFERQSQKLMQTGPTHWTWLWLAAMICACQCCHSCGAKGRTEFLANVLVSALEGYDAQIGTCAEQVDFDR